MFCKNVTVIAQMQERPIVMVSTQIDIAASAAISTVRPSIRHILSTMQVNRSSPSLTGTTINLHIVDKVCFRHKL